MKCPFCIKVCTKCKRVLVANEINFNKHKNGKWKLKSKCKQCEKKYHKQYYEDNKEEILKQHKQYVKEWHEDNKEYLKEYYKQYRENHKDKIKEYMNQYYEDNKEKIREQKKQYREDNKDKMSEYYKQYKKDNEEHLKEYHKQYYEDNKEEFKEKSRQYYEDNKEHCKEWAKQYYENNKNKILEYNKQYYENNPEKRFNQSNKRRSLEENQGNGITKGQWFEMMEFFNWCCAYSGEYLGGKENDKIRSIDHIISLSNGGLNEPWNCVPMLRNLNSSKYTSDMEDWYIQQDFFDIDRLLKIYEWIEYAYNKWGVNND